MSINDGSQSLTYFLTQKCNVFDVPLAFFLLLVHVVFLCPFHYYRLFWISFLRFWILNNTSLIAVIPLLLLEVVANEGLARSHSVEFLYFLLNFL